MDFETYTKAIQTQPEELLLDDSVSTGLSVRFHVAGPQLKPTWAGTPDEKIGESATNILEVHIPIPCQDNVSRMGGHMKKYGIY